MIHEKSNLEQQRFGLNEQLSYAKDALKGIPTEDALLLETFRLEALEHRHTIKRLGEESLGADDACPRHGTYMPHFEWHLEYGTLEKRLADEMLARRFAQSKQPTSNKKLD